MAVFRGVPVEDIIDSLQRTESFLRKLNIGPQVNSELDIWASDNPYDKLRAAPDARNVADFFKYSDSFDVLKHAVEIIRLHAATDTDGEALKIFQDLCRWGAFTSSSPEKTTLSPSARERRLYLDLKYAGMIIAQGPEIPAATQNKIDKEIEGLSHIHTEDETLDPDMLAQDVQDVLLKLREGDRQGAVDAIEKNGEFAKMMLELALFAGSGAKELPKIKAPGPFKRYGVLLDMSAGPFEVAKQASDIGEEMKKALEPFISTGDAIVLPGFSRVTGYVSSVGAAFLATAPDAAVAVANAMPDYTVVGHTGAAIERTTRLPLPKKSSKKFDI